ncbi:hypothetical protein HYW87_02290 [Candidatus Roizmanbacteria bacterium]|nr:hypothetical protein [Candidatus Roizmanbacteria bacterium]
MIVFTIAIIVSILNILHVIIGFARETSESIYMGVGHYYLDYYQYLQPIASGMRGKWTIENYFTTDDPIKTIFGPWQYLLLGKVGALFHLSPVQTYWFFVFFFSLILAVLIFRFIQMLLSQEPFYKQIAAFILSLFAAPFFRISKVGEVFVTDIFGFWNDRSVLWKRFGGIPYHLSAQIITIILLIITSDSLEKISKLSSASILKRGLLCGILIIVLFTFAPSYGILIVLSSMVTTSVLVWGSLGDRTTKKFSFILFHPIILLLVIPAGLFIKNYFSSEPYFLRISETEKAWQIHPSLKDVILTTGPIVFFALVGVPFFIKRLRVVRLLFLSFIAISYLFFFSDIPFRLGTTNMRFYSPLIYVFLGVLAVLIFKSKRTLLVATLFLFLLFLPANIKAFIGQLNDRNILLSPITYLPAEAVAGFEFLGKYRQEGNVLVSPRQSLGMVMPTFMDRRMYIGRPALTPSYVEKNLLSEGFFMGVMSNEEAEDFMRRNELTFVAVTSLEGYRNVPDYPFLRTIFKNNHVAILEVKRGQ